MGKRQHERVEGEPEGKRPASQWYWGDWKRDAGVRSSSLAARGLWMDMLALMHEGTPYGHLTFSTGVPFSPDDLAIAVGAPVRVVRSLLDELEAKGVPGKTNAGVYYSRRMVRDEQIRIIRKAAGKLGGNPHLRHNADAEDKPPDKHKDKHEDKQAVGDLDKQTDKQKQTPSTSSSPASSPSPAKSEKLHAREGLGSVDPDVAAQLSVDGLAALDWFCSVDAFPRGVVANVRAAHERDGHTWPTIDRALIELSTASRGQGFSAKGLRVFCSDLKRGGSAGGVSALDQFERGGEAAGEAA